MPVSAPNAGKPEARLMHHDQGQGCSCTVCWRTCLGLRDTGRGQERPAGPQSA